MFGYVYVLRIWLCVVVYMVCGMWCIGYVYMVCVYVLVYVCVAMCMLFVSVLICVYMVCVLLYVYMYVSVFVFVYSICQSSSGLRVGQPPPVRATAPPSMASSGDEMSSILDKLAAELQGAVQLLSAAALTSQHGRQLARLADDVTVARGARDSASHVHLVKLVSATPPSLPASPLPALTHSQLLSLSIGVRYCTVDLVVWLAL